MARKLRTTTPADLRDITAALVNLKCAREQLKRAGCKTAAEYVGRALKSAEGAERHAIRAQPVELGAGTTADARRSLRGLLGG